MTNASLDPGRFKRLLTRWTIIPVALGLLVAVGLVAQIQYLVVVAERLAQPERAIAQANGIRAHMIDAETGVRGFILANDEQLLVPYVSSRQSVEGAFEALRAEVAAHSEQAARVDRLYKQQREWFQLAEASMQLRRNGGDAVSLSREGTGSRLVEDMRRELDAFILVEVHLLELGIADSQRATAIAMWSTATLALILGIAMGIATRRQLGTISARKELNDAVRHQTERLEAGVRARTADLEEANGLLEIESARHLAAREEVQRYADEVHDLYENAPCGYHSLDDRGVIEFINDTELKWLDLTRDEAVGRLNFRDLLTPASQATFDTTFPRFKSTGRAEGLEFEVVRSDGNPMFVLVSGTATYDQSGKYLSSRSTLIDITRRRLVEMDAARARERYSALIRASSMAVYTLDANGYGTESSVASAWEAITGHALDPRDPAWWVETIDPDDRDRIRSAFTNAIAMRTPYEFELRVRTASGADRVFLSKAVPIFETDGTFREWVGTLADVTARAVAERTERDLNEQLATQVKELYTANAELDAFAYSVSHDLRAPLRAIDGFSRILSDDCSSRLTPDCLGHIVTIRENTVYMGRLIDDLLAFSRLGRTPVSVELVDTRALVQTVLDSMSVETDGHHATIVLGDLPPCTADPNLLKRVFHNLLENAMKYSGKRADSTVEIGSAPWTGDGEESVFFVRDNGVGFDMRYAKKLFGVFQRLHRSEDYEGTGVGLAIVHRIVSKHGGRVWAEGALDTGATFSFSIPAEVPS